MLFNFFDLFFISIGFSVDILEKFPEPIEVDVVVEEGHFRWKGEGVLNVFVFRHEMELKLLSEGRWNKHYSTDILINFYIHTY